MKSNVLAFEVLNLRFNPFGELPTEQWLKASIVDIDHLVEPLLSQNVAVQFLADHGRGKTTHLQKLYQRLSGYPYIKLLENASTPTFKKTDLIFIDSIENINIRQRNKLYKNTGSIALTTHIDLSNELKENGFKVITQNVSCNCALKLLQILNTRIEVARNKEGNIPLLDIETVKHLKSLFGDNIRAIQNYLYEEFQHLKEKENVKV